MPTKKGRYLRQRTCTSSKNPYSELLLSAQNCFKPIVLMRSGLLVLPHHRNYQNPPSCGGFSCIIKKNPDRRGPETKSSTLEKHFPPNSLLLGSLLTKSAGRDTLQISSGRVSGACPPCVRLDCALAAHPNLVRHVSAVVRLCSP